VGSVLDYGGSREQRLRFIGLKRSEYDHGRDIMFVAIPVNGQARQNRHPAKAEFIGAHNLLFI
jgi:hypothetical protein